MITPTDSTRDTTFSAADLARRTIARRAVEAIICGIPLVNFDLMYQSHVRDVKGAINQISYWSRIPSWKNQTLTPNPDTIYLMPFFSTKDVGPVVLEIPPADEGSISGTIMNCWQEALEDVGPAGMDKGKGGKYLMTPPDFKDKVPDGYLHLPSTTYQGYALLRSILKSRTDADIAKAVTYGKRIKLYPLSQADNPPQTTFLDAVNVVFNGIIPYDVRFFESLHRMVQTEPWLERDRAMIDPLKSLGIEQGTPFAPDRKTTETMASAGAEARAWFDVSYETRYPPFNSGHHWFVPAEESYIKAVQSGFTERDAFPIDARGTLYYCAYSSVKHLGAGQSYLFVSRDKDGNALDGATTCRLHVPPRPPVKQYWSAVLYDFATHALIRDMPHASKSSQSPDLQTNADGSVDVYVGPKPPGGKESNWIPTDATGRFEALFRFYGPEKPLFDKTWFFRISRRRKSEDEYGGDQPTSDQIREEHAYAVGVQAALWGRPFPEYLHSMYEGVKAGAAHLNYLHKFSALKTAADRYVNTPNNVSIDAYGNADLTTEPVVISVAALREPRWSIVQIGDMFDEIVYNIGGSRGPEPGLFCLTGPDYHGPIPATMKEIKLRTQLAVVANRVFVNGESDIPAARAVQAGIHMLPLSVFQRQGLKYEIPKSDPASLTFVPAAPEPLRLFERIGFGMTRFLSASGDYADPMVASFHQVGLSVARGFQWQALADVTRRGLARAAVTAEQINEDAYANAAEVVSGWRYSMGGGRAGYDLALRAAFATHLLGANVPEQLFYPNVRVDAQNRPLTGVNKYTLRFEKETLPPVSVFWNMSMYDEKEFFIENDFKRYSIGSTTDGLKTEADGSVTIYIQHENPGAEKQSNWLPAPADGFNLTMRLYGAESPILDGSYRLPAVTRLD